MLPSIVHFLSSRRIPRLSELAPLLQLHYPRLRSLALNTPQLLNRVIFKIYQLESLKENNIEQKVLQQQTLSQMPVDLNSQMLWTAIPQTKISGRLTQFGDAPFQKALLVQELSPQLQKLLKSPSKQSLAQINASLWLGFSQTKDFINFGLKSMFLNSQQHALQFCLTLARKSNFEQRAFQFLFKHCFKQQAIRKAYRDKLVLLKQYCVNNCQNPSVKELAVNFKCDDESNFAQYDNQKNFQMLKENKIKYTQIKGKFARIIKIKDVNVMVCSPQETIRNSLGKFRPKMQTWVQSQRYRRVGMEVQMIPQSELLARIKQMV